MSQGIHRPTLVAIAVAAYAIANIAHEGVGHGGSCLAVGGKPEVLSAVHFECDVEGLPGIARKRLAAGGTLVNLTLGGAAFLSVCMGFTGIPRALAQWVAALKALNLSVGDPPKIGRPPEGL